MIRYVLFALVISLVSCGPAQAPVLPPSASAPLPEVSHDVPRVEPPKKNSTTVNDALDRVDERLKAIKERDIHTVK